MILNKKKNKGFTLVELIVAVAVLALLITAVVTIMSHETVILKKNEADISVQNAAQETYNDISDMIMQAKSIRIVGYATDDGSEITFPKKKAGEDYSGSVTLYAFSKKSEAIGDDLNFEDNGIKMSGGAGTAGTFLKTVSVSGGVSTSQYTKLYLTNIYVDYSVPYEEAYKGEVAVPTGTDKDTCSARIMFDGDKIYVMKTYKYMTKLNSTFTTTSTEAEKDACLYTSKLNYLKNGAATISAAVATVDSENQSISLELSFLDNGMTYNVSGITNVRNSYVFVDPK